MQLNETYNDLKQKYDELSGQLTMLEKQQEEDKKALKYHKENIKLCAKGSSVMSLIQKSTKEKIKKSIEDLVTYALRFIHESNCKFSLEFSKRGSMTELDMNIKDEGFEEPHSLENTSAGGHINIIAVALRVIFMKISNAKIPLILDESFSNLSKEYLRNASDFLRYIYEKLGFQVILITQKPDFSHNTDKVIKF